MLIYDASKQSKARSLRDIKRLVRLSEFPCTAVWVTGPDQAYALATKSDYLHGFRIYSSASHVSHEAELMSRNRARTYLKIIHLPL